MQIYGADAMVISGMSPTSVSTSPLSAHKTKVADVAERFSSFFESSLDAANGQLVHADRTAEQFLMGEDIPVHSVMMEMAKADTTLRLATSVVQKVIDAYLEVARMQI